MAMTMTMDDDDDNNDDDHDDHDDHDDDYDDVFFFHSGTTNVKAKVLKDGHMFVVHIVDPHFETGEELEVPETEMEWPYSMETAADEEQPGSFSPQFNGGVARKFCLGVFPVMGKSKSRFDLNHD